MLLDHCLRAVFAVRGIQQVVVVAPQEDLVEAQAVCGAVAGAAAAALLVVSGGSTRQASVAAGLAALAPSVDVVLVHDAARSFTPVQQFDRVLAAVVETGAGVVPALSLSDTIKSTDGSGTVLATLDRTRLISVQTPQGFPRRALEDAYAVILDTQTDDAAVFSAAGGTVTVVAGDALAFKITTPSDLRRAEQLESERRASTEGATLQHPRFTATRTGIGIDVHAFDDAHELWLGGLLWPGETGLSGHSDGDVVCHAICDALLSAAGLGDIGGNFGTDDPRFAGAHGDVFLTETVARVRAAGFDVGNVAVQVIAIRPKIGPRRLEIETALSALIGAPVSLSATTTDGLGFTGRGEGIAVIATALVQVGDQPMPTFTR